VWAGTDVRIPPHDARGAQLSHDRFFFVNTTMNMTWMGVACRGRPCVVGSGVYAIESPLAAAAVHAGVLGGNALGLVRLRLVKGYEQYVGSVQHGLRSASGDGRDQPGYQFLPLQRDRARVQAALPPLPLFASFSGRCYVKGEVFDVYVQNEPVPSLQYVRGTDVYSSDSFTQYAAVHAGVLPDLHSNGVFTVTCAGKFDHLRGTSRHGINSTAFDGPHAVDGVVLSSYRPLPSGFPGRVVDLLPRDDLED
jgi:hypothetical protein